MKVVYIAHPIKGSVDLNIELIKNILKKINHKETDVCPIAPYVGNGLDDNIPYQRERGIKNNIELIGRGFIDEMWMYGMRLSDGMKQEILLAMKHGIKVVCKEDFILWDIRQFVTDNYKNYPSAKVEHLLLVPEDPIKETPRPITPINLTRTEAPRLGAQIAFTIIFTKQDNSTVEKDIEAFDDLDASRKATELLSINNYKDWRFANDQPSLIGSL